MRDVEDVGEVSTEGGVTIRWTIPRYLHMPREVDTALFSPHFTLRGGERCRLLAFPGGFKLNNTEGWFCTGCCILSLPRGSSLRCSVVGRDGQEILHTVMTKERNLPCYYSQRKWIRQAELEARSQELLPGGQLRLVIRVDLPGRREQSEEEPGSGTEDAATTLGASSCTRPSQSNEGLHNLALNFKDLYVQGDDCDFTIRVRGREFRTHRLVLKVRVPAFCAMLTHDMAENKEGVVDIQDCDPDAFNQFLLFVYSGRVENLTTDNMCGLYVLGDKYGLPDLKNVCLDFMKTSLTVETICDVISLASTHDEAGLLELATDFFVRNSEQILADTARWKEFMQENPTQGHELILTTVKKLKSK